MYIVVKVVWKEIILKPMIVYSYVAVLSTDSVDIDREFRSASMWLGDLVV